MPLVATRRQVIQDVTRRQGFASRCGRCADTGPGARVITTFLAAAGLVVFVLHAWRLPAAAVVQLAGAHLRGLEAAGMAAFWVLDAWLVCSLFVLLVLPHG